MLKNFIIIALTLFLCSCVSNIAPLNRHDEYYNSILKVNKPYTSLAIPNSQIFHIPMENYKAIMKDDFGIYYAAPHPIMKKDSENEETLSTGGLYYQFRPSRKVFLYFVNPKGATVLEDPFDGLNYTIIKP